MTISIVCQPTDINEVEIEKGKEEVDSEGKVSHKDSLETLQLAVRC